MLASADADGTVRLWNPATGQPVGTLRPPRGFGVDAVAFSPDGKVLASADGDGTVRLWNPATGQAIGTIRAGTTSLIGTWMGWRSARTASCWPAPTTTARCGCGIRPPARPSVSPSRPHPEASGVGVAFSPDGKLLASADNDGTVRLWNPATSQAIRTVPAAQPWQREEWRSARTERYWPAPTTTARCGCGTRPPAKPSEPGSPTRAAHESVTFGPDGKVLAGADEDGTVRLWNPATGEAIGTIRAANPEPAWTGWRSARTASCWPAPTSTARCGCGTQLTARPSALSFPLLPRMARKRGGVQSGRQNAGQR